MPFHSIAFPDLHPSPGDIIALHELPGDPFEPQSSIVLAMNKSGELWKLNLHNGNTARLIQTEISDMNLLHPVQIVVSMDGTTAAVSGRYGRHAAVYDLVDGKELMQLSRDDYHHDASMFPLCFAKSGQRLLLIHGTEWNRLDLTDVRTGERLSERIIPTYNDAGYLNYFHGALSVSPDQRWIVNSGWVWQPLGVLRAWSLDNWQSNPLESEDGPSVRDLWQTLDWDLPMTWIGPSTVAVWGQVDEDMVEKEDWHEEGVSPAIVLFDVQTGSRAGVLTGVPEFDTTSMLEGVFPHPQAGMAAERDLLFLWRNGLDLQVWNTLNRTCVATTTEVTPRMYHSQGRMFIGIDANHSLKGWNYEVD